MSFSSVCQEALELISLNHLKDRRGKKSDKSINLSEDEFLPGDIWFRLHDVTIYLGKYISCRNVIKVNERNFLEGKKKTRGL